MLQTTKRFATRLVTLRTEAGTIVTTPEHPFARRGGGWTPAGKLSAGDRIESQRATDGVMILGSETREVPATPVYNLTVARTHAYFVGSRGLLVHNVDCRDETTPRGVPDQQRREDGSTSAKRPMVQDLLDEMRKNELRDPASRLSLRELREAARKAAAERAKPSRPPRPIPKPSSPGRLIPNDRPNDPNCAYCTLTGLSGADKVSTFHQESGFPMWDNNGRALSPQFRQFQQMLKSLRLTSRHTPRAKIIPGRKSEENAAKKKATEEHPRPTFPYAAQSIEFMKRSSANTFAVTFFFWDGTEHRGHGLLAVRLPDKDGTIVYLDLQAIPPVTHYHLDPHVYDVRVAPTDVDWRFNRQIYGNIKERAPIEHRHAYAGPE